MFPTPLPPGTLALTADDLEALDKARSWARFMAIVGFIGCGLFGILMLVSLVAVLALPSATSMAPALGLGALTLFGVGFGLVYSGLLMKYASGVAKHVSGDSTALARAFSAVKLLWIITVVSYSLSILFTIGMMVAQMLGLTPATPVQPG
jgi:hypothetical protein